MELGYLPTQSKNSTVEEKQLAVRLIKACKAGSLSLKQEAALGKLAEGAAEVGHVAGLQALLRAGLRLLPDAETRIAKAEELMQQVRDLGRYPHESARRSLAERRLAERLRNARKRKRLSPEQESELQALRQAIRIVQTEEKMQELQASSCDAAERQLAERLCKAWQSPSISSEQEAELQALQQASRVAQAEGMMQEVRGFGRYPMESRQDVRERQLADKLRKARKAKRFSPAQEAELQVLQQAARDARAEARIAQAEELMQQKLCDAWKAKKFSPEQEAELKALQEVEIDSSEKARQGGELLFCQKRKR
jgi:hypothetical protein